MFHRMFHTRSREFTMLLALLTAILVFCIILFPDQAFQASLKGLHLWWTIVFPSLLPFLIASEILVGFGIVRGLGTLLEPLMRLCFRIPGEGGWAFALGCVAGMPAGAQITGKLRADGTIGREEGERLLALSHVGSPFFMLGVVGAGFLHQPQTGTVIAVIHYLSALGAGVFMRFFWNRTVPDPQAAIADPVIPSAPAARRAKTKKTPSLLLRSFQAMHQARLQDGRTFGKLLGDSVTTSIQTLMIAGGYVMMFSVILNTVTLSRISGAANAVVSAILLPFGIPRTFADHWLPSLFEVHLGAFAFSQSDPSSLEWKAAFVGLALAWSGLSHHLQVISLVQHTDLRYYPFLVARVFHGAAAFALTLLLWKPLNDWFPRVEPSLLRLDPSGTAAGSGVDSWNIWLSLPDRTLQWIVLTLVLAGLSLLSGTILAYLRRRPKTD